MNEQITLLRTLILKELDPAYFKLDPEQVSFWLNEIPLIKIRLFNAMQEEVLGQFDNNLVERHIKQIQYDCIYLLNCLSKYKLRRELPAVLYQMAGDCLDQIMIHVDERYAGFFNFQKAVPAKYVKEEVHPRIRVLFSVDALAYFFKLLNKAGALDAGPTSQLMVAIAKNFVTPGIGDGFISPNSVTTKYKQVVQTTARSVRPVLSKMLKLLDDEFEMV